MYSVFIPFSSIAVLRNSAEDQDFVAPSIVQRKWEGEWRERQSLFLTVYSQHEEKKLCLMQACGDLKKGNEKALLVFENVLQNGKDRREEALLKGTVLKTRNSKSRHCHLQFWHQDRCFGDYLECRRTWLVSIDLSEKEVQRDGDKMLRDRIPYRSSHLGSRMVSSLCSWMTENLYTALGLRDVERSLVREGSGCLFLFWVEK